MLDDACNYLGIRNIKGNHRTIRLPPRGETTKVVYIQQSLPVNHSNNSQELEESRLLVWSAADEDGLKRIASVYEDYIKQRCNTVSKDFWEDLAYTLATKRSNFDWRSYVVTTDSLGLEDLQAKLSKPEKKAEGRNLVMVFTGQGAQYPQMGVELLGYDVFRESLQDADSYFSSLGCDWSLLGRFRILFKERVKLTHSR